MKMKNFEIQKKSKIFDLKKFKIFIENCMKMENFEIENFRFFSISKIFECRFQVAPTFFVFNKKF